MARDVCTYTGATKDRKLVLDLPRKWALAFKAGDMEIRARPRVAA